MKTHLAVGFSIASLIIGSLSTTSYARDFSDAEIAPFVENIEPVQFEAKVLKAYNAKDGVAIFRAYVVNWNGQEVIVSDPLADSDFKEGDTITVLVMNSPYPEYSKKVRLLAFVILPPRLLRMPK